MVIRPIRTGIHFYPELARSGQSIINLRDYSTPLPPTTSSLLTSPPVTMSFAPSRAVLRQSRLVSRRGFTVRQASTTTDAAASKAKETASKASEGLSKVASSAGPAISSAVSGAGSALMKVGGRTGKAIKFVDCMTVNCICREQVADTSAFLALIPPTVYYTRVGIELSKLIFRGQKMTPPYVRAYSSEIGFQHWSSVCAPDGGRVPIR